MTMEDSRNYLKKIFSDLEERTLSLDAQKTELERREKELEICEVVHESERGKLSLEKIMREREMRTLNKKFIQLENTLNAKYALELGIESMREALQGMEQIGENGDMEVNKKMDTIQQELEEKKEELDGLRALNQALILKECQCNDELKDTRSELIGGLLEVPRSGVIGIKIMGELSCEPFYTASKRKYFGEEADSKGPALFSPLTHYLEDPNWCPFRIVRVDGCSKDVADQEVIDEEDEKLKALRNEYGDEVQKVVTTALAERNAYKSTGQPIELWNYKEGRKATLREGVSHILQRLKIQLRKTI